jgi:DNA-binding winged helix-turn-helix (wHTH) protein
MEIALPDRVRFGVFELDLKAGELHKRGRVVLLQQQPFQVLLMLVERRGELAARDEIRRKLWPNDTVVEFDHAINNAIKKLRQALGDSVQKPKYIETVGRRGYRLIMPVEWVGAIPAGLSVGPRGLHVGVNRRGMYTSAGIPVTGLYAVHHIRSSAKLHPSSAEQHSNVAGSAMGCMAVVVFALIILVFVVVAYSLR